MNVIAVFRKTGTFQKDGKSIPYDNAMIALELADHEVSNNCTPIEGNPVELVKVKYAVYDAEVKRLGGSILGMDVRFYYNRYGNVEGFNIL